MARANLTQDTASFIDQVNRAGGKPLYMLTPQEARQVLRKVQNVKVEEAEVVTDETKVALENGREMRVIVVRPAAVDDPLPMIFYIHGGGWVMGDEVTHKRLISELAVKVPAAVVFPVYEPSPEAQYPQTTQDLFSVLNYMVEYGAKYNLDGSQLVVAGDSVGGNMAAVMAIMAKEKENTPKIDFQLLLYPVTDADFYNQSYKDYADGPWLTRKAMEWFWDQYAPDESQREEIYASPLRATPEQLADLPPALIITDENDVLRDEGEAYARKLAEAGVKTASVRVNGTIHDFMMLNPLAESEPTRAAMALAVFKLREVFEVQKSKQVMD